MATKVKTLKQLPNKKKKASKSTAMIKLPLEWGRAHKLTSVLVFVLIFGGLGAYLFGTSHAAETIDPNTWAPSGSGTYFFDRSNQTGNPQTDYTARESAFGRKFDGHLYYVPADVTPADLAGEHWSLATDKVPFVIISWATGNNPNNIIPLINSGSYDKDINDFANSVKSELSPYGHVLIRPFWEFNYTGTEWNDTHYNNDPKQFIAAWQHFVNIFRNDGVTNVKWDWNPNRVNAGQSQDPTPYYPGSSYVDWIGIDAYPKNQFLTLQQLVTTSGGSPNFDWYDTFKSYGKPLMVGETGIQPSSAYGGGAPTRATWWSDAVSELKGPLSQLRAIEYFDANQGTNWMYDAGGSASGDSPSQSVAAAKSAASDCILNVLSSGCGGQQQSNPSVSITSPSPNATVSGTVNVSMATQNGPSKVELYVDNSLVSTNVSSASYTYSLNTKNLSDGTHTLLAKAYDSSGTAYPSTSVTITVNNNSGTSVSISAPAANSTISGTVNVEASVSGNVSKVSFLVDGAVVGTATSMPYMYSWNTKNVSDGTHSLEAVAYDASGVAHNSSTVTVTVSNNVVSTGGSIPNYDHVVLVMEENHGFSQIIGDTTDAPYINTLANGGALFTNSHGITHPSFPNYLALFSGSVQGAVKDTCPPPGSPYSAANLGSELIGAGDTFGAYAESLPSSLKSCGPSPYAGRHVPSVWFSNVPASTAHDFSSFPTSASGFASLPKVSFVTPGLNHDMHSFGTETPTQEISNGDSWLSSNISAYANWAKANNSLLILQWDEDEGTTGNGIPTIFYGANVKTGKYSESITHYSVLRTLEDMYGLASTGSAKTASAITDVWSSSTGGKSLTGTITSPSSGSTVSGTVPVNINVSGGTGSDTVQLFLNGNPQTTMTTSPFVYDWDTSSLTAGTYSLQAKVSDTAGDAITTPAVSVKVSSNAPQPPTGLAASNVKETTLSLNWKAPASGVAIDHYLVYRDNQVIGMPTGTTYADSGLLPNTTYTYAVASVTADGTVSAMSNSISVTTGSISVVDNQPPTVPGNLQGNASSASQVNLSWSASTDNVGVAGYKVLRDGTVIATANTTSFGDGSVNAGTTYNYTVEAFDAAGNISGPSNQVSVTTPSQQPKPPKPPTGNNGVTMQYFPNNKVNGKAYAAVMPAISGSFSNPPLPKTPKSTKSYTLHWTGRLQVPKAGRYTIYLSTSKGASNLFLRNKRFIADRSAKSGAQSATITLQKGQYNFLLTFADSATKGSVNLAWSGPGMKKQPIPTKDFYPVRSKAGEGKAP